MCKYTNKIATYYDMIYEKKNYLEEIEYIEKAVKEYSKSLFEEDLVLPIKNFFDIGSGTGNHSIIFAKRHKNFDIWGIEPSEYMWKKSIEKVTNDLELDNCTFLKGNLKDILGSGRKKAKFCNYGHLMVSLFHVINHILTFKDLENFINDISFITSSGGLFIVDCWNKIEVLCNPPKIMSREHYCKNNDFVSIECIPFLNKAEEIVELKYNYFLSSTNKFYDKFNFVLKHKLWDIQLLSDLLKNKNFEVLQINGAFEFNKEITPLKDVYKIVIVARKL